MLTRMITVDITLTRLITCAVAWMRIVRLLLLLLACKVLLGT